MKAMASILWDCVRLNLTIGKYGRQTQPIGASTEIKRIQQYANDIRNLEYSKAVSTIKTDNALLAGRDIQARYSETVFWEIGAKLLDPTKMRPAKGAIRWVQRNREGGYFKIQEGSRIWDQPGKSATLSQLVEKPVRNARSRS
jgi:hypothetical protein